MTRPIRPTPTGARSAGACSRASRRACARARVSAPLLWTLAALLLACGPLSLDGKKASEAASSESTASAGDQRVAVIIDGDPLTVAEVDEFMKESFLEELLRKPEDEIFEARENAIRNLIQRRVIDAEAEARGLTPEALFEEITSAAGDPTDEEVAAWYESNRERLRGAELDDIADQIRSFLANERRSQAWRAFLEPRLDALSYDIVLAPPRKELEATRLVRGPADAPVTIMAFSDYQCPYCIRSEPVLAEVLARYPEQVRLIHRHFPLDNIHPFARPASEAAMCADEQGKFWAYHDAIFARRGRLEEGSFDEIAKEVGLDVDAFDQCVEERRYADFVRQDLEAGRLAGVTGTPAFFINGIPLKGARDADALSRVIDSELERLQRPES